MYIYPTESKSVLTSSNGRLRMEEPRGRGESRQSCDPTVQVALDDALALRRSSQRVRAVFPVRPVHSPFRRYQGGVDTVTKEVDSVLSSFSSCSPAVDPEMEVGSSRPFSHYFTTSFPYGATWIRPRSHHLSFCDRIPDAQRRNPVRHNLQEDRHHFDRFTLENANSVISESRRRKKFFVN
jgi:hypothetical protein